MQERNVHNQMVIGRPMGHRGAGRNPVSAVQCQDCGHRYGSMINDFLARHCPNCQNGSPGLPYPISNEEAAERNALAAIGREKWVAHQRFGLGRIVGQEAIKLVVDFMDDGERRRVLPHALSRVDLIEVEEKQKEFLRRAGFNLDAVILAIHDTKRLRTENSKLKSSICDLQTENSKLKSSNCDLQAALTARDSAIANLAARSSDLKAAAALRDSIIAAERQKPWWRRLFARCPSPGTP